MSPLVQPHVPLQATHVASPELLARRARLIDRQAQRAGLQAIWERVRAGARLTPEEGLALYATKELPTVGAMAEYVALRRHGRRVFFNVNQHINYTNICNKLCRFCAFQRLPGQEGAYAMTPEEVGQKIKERLHEPITEVHMVAGVHPKLPYSYYLDILRAVKAARPSIHIKAFTMVEIHQIQKLARKPLPEVFAELKEAGLGSLPGGGAEIFAQRVHDEIFKLKIDGERWLEIAREAHRAGLFTNATMLYGHIETLEERIDHLGRLRALQDETNGFQAFIALSFHPKNTEMDYIPEPTGWEDLRNLAVSRLFLDNFLHVKAYWIMLGLPMAQLALTYGATDLDGTVSEERIYHDAGAQTPQALSRAQLERFIRDAGREPVERDTIYRAIERAG
jgi:aminodeoxyfutalosine synthase